MLCCGSTPEISKPLVETLGWEPLDPWCSDRLFSYHLLKFWPARQPAPEQIWRDWFTSQVQAQGCPAVACGDHASPPPKQEEKGENRGSLIAVSGLPWTVACQTPLSMGFLGKNIGVGYHSSPGDLPDPGIEPMSPSLQANSLPSEPAGKITW